MKPLILEYAQAPKLVNLDYSLIEYSNKKNLSVIKNTEIPAVTYVNTVTEVSNSGIAELLDTSTETKSFNEPSDGDDNYSSIKLLLDTETISKGNDDPTDADHNFRSNLKQLLDTSTQTFDSTEPSDGDDTYASLKLLMDTQTMTEAVEDTDSDR